MCLCNFHPHFVEEETGSERFNVCLSRSDISISDGLTPSLGFFLSKA